jgi:DNA-binding response OmpR family regulator
MHILIADDDLTSRTMLEGILKKEGHVVTATVNGLEAWRALQQPAAPPLLILDWMMPEMDGPEVVRLVRAQPTDRPPYIIMLTSRSDKADIIAGLAAGADDYLAKPFDPGELHARVDVGRRLLETQANLSAKVEELRQALDQIKTLRGILPICANCKKVRDDQGYWDQVESYISRHSEASFSHGICPDCIKKIYPEIAADYDAYTKGEKEKP